MNSRTCTNLYDNARGRRVNNDIIWICKRDETEWTTEQEERKQMNVWYMIQRSACDDLRPSILQFLDAGNDVTKREEAGGE